MWALADFQGLKTISSITLTVDIKETRSGYAAADNNLPAGGILNRLPT